MWYIVLFLFFGGSQKIILPELGFAVEGGAWNEFIFLAGFIILRWKLIR